MKDTIKIFSETGCIPHDVLWKYRQGMLSPKEKHEVELHLTDCELCSDALAGMSEMNSDKIISEIRKDVRRIIEPKKVFRLYDYRWVAAAASVALLFVFYYVINSKTESDNKEIAQLMKPEENKSEEKIVTLAAPPPVEKVTAATEEPAPQKKNKKESADGLVHQAMETEQPNKMLPRADDKQSQTISETTSASDVTPVAAGAAEKSTGYAANAEPAPAPVKDEESLALQHKTLQKVRTGKKESSKVTYFSELKVARTPAMTPAENFDSVNTGVSSTYENKNEAETNVHAKELPFVYSETLRKGLNYYHDKKTVEAVEYFNEILDHFPKDINATFYKGLCYFDAGNYFPARELFDKALLNPDKTFYEEAKFKLALCYVGLDQPDEAKKLLKEIVAEKGFYSEQAKEELKKLE